MTRIVRRFARGGRILRTVAAVLATTSGAFYVVHPPNTTIGFFEAVWPPQLWGVLLAVGGITTAVGLVTRLLSIEQLGMLAVAIGAGLLAIAQTMVMAVGDVTWTRGGGTGTNWMLVAFAAARCLELSADIRSARPAERQQAETRADPPKG